MNDSSFMAIEKTLIKENTIIALSRYDIQSDGSIKLFNEPSSQDTWIFKSPIRIPKNSDFYFGIFGCDNRIAFLLKNKGYILKNLPYDIITIHYHTSNFKTSTERINGDIMPVSLEKIENFKNNSSFYYLILVLLVLLLLLIYKFY